MRRSATIACCMLAAVAVTWVRWLALGRLSVYGDLSIWPHALFGGFAGLAGWAYLSTRFADPADADSWRPLLVGACLVHLAAAAALPLTSNDLFANLAFGKLAVFGDNPFLSTPVMLPAHETVRALVDPRWLQAPFAYGPVIAALDAGVARAGSLIAMMVAYKAVMLASAIATVVAAYAVCRREGLDHPRERFCLFALCPLFAWEASAQAHNDVVLVAALLGFVWAARRDRELAAVLCLGLGILCKFVAAPVAAIYLVYIARRSVTRAAVLALLLVGLAVIVTLPWWQGSDTLGGLMKVVSPDAGRTTRSIADLFVVITSPLGAGVQRIAYDVCWLGGLALSAAIGLTALYRARTVALVIHYSLLLLLAGDLVAAPWVHPWYALWLLPLALVHADPRWLRLIARYSVLVILDYTLPLDSFTTVAIDLYIGAQAIGLLRSPID
ncbi:MAG: glycosyltransferase 87 family protein [Kofleriaceae bacterium]